MFDYYLHYFSDGRPAVYRINKKYNNVNFLDYTCYLCYDWEGSNFDNLGVLRDHRFIKLN